MPKPEPIKESYDFCKIIMGIKYRLEMNVRISQNNQNESFSTQQDLCEELRNFENGARIRKIHNLE